MVRPARHGTRSKYNAGCRCEPCTVANRVAKREADRAKRRVAYGIEPAPPPRFIDATEARDHIVWLRGEGVGTRTISSHSGLARTTILKIAIGQVAQISQRTADRILAVGRHRIASRAYIDSTPAHELVADLRRRGYTQSELSRYLGYRSRSLQLQKRITPAKLARIEQLHRQLTRRAS